MHFFILNKLEKVCHFIQRLIGINCFVLAKVTYVLACVVRGIPFQGALFWWSMLFPVIQLSIFHHVLKHRPELRIPYRFKVINEVEQLVENNLPKGLKNPYGKNEYFPIIALFPLMTFVLSWTISRGSFAYQQYLLVSSICMFLTMYLTVCTPLPTGKSKLRKGLEKLARFFNPEPEAIPSPA